MDKLKSAGSLPIRYGTGIGKMVFQYGAKSYFRAELPEMDSFFSTNADFFKDTLNFLRNPSEAIHRNVERAMNTEMFKSMTEIVANAVDDLKTGNFYDENRMRGGFNDGLSDMDGFDDNDFGGFDFDGFDENGDFNEDYDSIPSEPDPSTEASMKQDVEIAQVQEDNADERAKVTVGAIGSAASAMIDNDNKNVKRDIGFRIKQHSQSIAGMQNLATLSAAIHTTLENSAKITTELIREVGSQVVGKLDEVTSILGEMRDYMKPPEKQEEEYTGTKNDPLADGTLNIPVYLKKVVSNAKSAFNFDMIAGSLGMATNEMFLGALKDSPWAALLGDTLFRKLLPASFTQEVKNFNNNLQGFFPALLQKLYNQGEDDTKTTKQQLLGKIFGFKNRSNSGIELTNGNINEKAIFTNKVAKAITDVIPMQLAKIISLMSGEREKIFNYQRGEFVDYTSIVSSRSRALNDLAGKTEIYSMMRDMVNSTIRFETQEQKKKTEDFLYNAIQKYVSSYKLFNPYEDKDSVQEFLGSDDINTGIFLGALKAIQRDKLMGLARDSYYARESRNSGNIGINRDMHNSGEIMAFSGLTDEDITNTIFSRARTGATGADAKTVEEIEARIRGRRFAQKGQKTTIEYIQDIRNMLAGGIITFALNVGSVTNSTDVDNLLNQSVSEVVDAGDDTSFAGIARSRLRAIRNSEQMATVNDTITEEIHRVERNIQENNERSREAARRDRLSITNDTMVDYSAFASPEHAQDAFANVQVRQMTDEEIDADPLYNEVRENVRSQVDRFRNTTDTIAEKTGIRKLLGSIQEIMKQPFSLVEKGMRAMDTAMFKIVYGEDADSFMEADNDTSLISRLTAFFQGNLSKLHSWFSNAVLGENGFLTKFGSKLKDVFSPITGKITDGVKDIGNTIKEKVIGVKGDDGKYSGGFASNFMNNVHEEGSSLFGSIGAYIKDSFDTLLHGKKDENGVRLPGEKGVIGSFKDGFEKFKTFLLGKDDEDPYSRDTFNLVRSEVTKGIPGTIVGAGAGAAATMGVGMLTSLWLPGGPIFGGIIGAGLGFINSSDKFKDYIFGKEDITDGKRRGGMIGEDVQDWFKKFMPKTAIGAGVGAFAGNLGLLPLGIGPVLGGIIGGLGGMVSSSERLKKALFGEEGDDDSGLISKNTRQMFIKSAPAALLGGMGGLAAWNLIMKLGVGLLPGLAMLPGGPIFAALGAIGLGLNADNIKNFLFGQESETETTDSNGNKVKVKSRSGGVFGTMFDTVRDKVANPFFKGMNNIGHKIMDWFDTDIANPFHSALEPMKEAMRETGNHIKEGFANFATHIRESIDKSTEEAYGKPFSKFMKEDVFGKLRSIVSGLFGIIGKVVGGILSSPFKIMNYAFNGGKITKTGTEQREYDPRNAISGGFNTFGLLQGLRRGNKYDDNTSGSSSSSNTYSPLVSSTADYGSGTGGKSKNNDNTKFPNIPPQASTQRPSDDTTGDNPENTPSDTDADTTPDNNTNDEDTSTPRNTISDQIRDAANDASNYGNRPDSSNTLGDDYSSSNNTRKKRRYSGIKMPTRNPITPDNLPPDDEGSPSNPPQNDDTNNTPNNTQPDTDNQETESGGKRKKKKKKEKKKPLRERIRDAVADAYGTNDDTANNTNTTGSNNGQNPLPPNVDTTNNTPPSDDDSPDDDSSRPKTFSDYRQERAKREEEKKKKQEEKQRKKEEKQKAKEERKKQAREAREKLKQPQDDSPNVANPIPIQDRLTDSNIPDNSNNPNIMPDAAMPSRANPRNNTPPASNNRPENNTPAKQPKTTKPVPDIVNDIQKDTHKIADEVDGQLGSVGWNLEKIRQMLENELGPAGDDDEDPDNPRRKSKKRRGFFSKLFGKFTNIFSGARDFVKDKIDSVSNFFTGLWDNIKTTGKKMWDIVTFIPKQVGKGFMFIGGMVADGVKSIGPAVGSMLKSVKDSITSFAKGTLKLVGTVISSAWNGLLKLTGATIKGLVTVSEKLITGTYALVRDSMAGLASIVKGLYTVGKDILILGKNIAGAAWNGIKNVGKFAIDAVTGRKRRERRNAATGALLDTVRNIDKNISIIKGNMGDTPENESGNELTAKIKFTDGYLNKVDMLSGKPVTEPAWALPVFLTGIGDRIKLPIEEPSRENTPTGSDMQAVQERQASRVAEKMKEQREQTEEKHDVKQYINAYRQFNAGADNAKNTKKYYDEQMENADDKNTIQALRDVQQLNQSSGTTNSQSSEEGEKKEEGGGILDTIMKWLPIILPAIFLLFKHGKGIKEMAKDTLDTMFKGDDEDGDGERDGNWLDTFVTGGNTPITSATSRGMRGGLKGVLTKLFGNASIAEIGSLIGDDAARAAYKESMEAGVREATEASSKGFFGKLSKMAAVRKAKQAAKAQKKLYRATAPFHTIKKGFSKAGKFLYEHGGDKLIEDSGKLASTVITGAKNTVTKVGGIAGKIAGNAVEAASNSNVGVALKNLFEKFAASFTKFLKNGAIVKLFGPLKKLISPIISSVVNFLKTTVAKDLLKRLGKGAASSLGRFAAGASTRGVLTGVFGVMDFVNGMRKAGRYFQISESDVTLGMKITSALVETVIGLIAVFPGAGTIASMIASLFTAPLVNLIYKIVSNDDAEAELAQKQESLKQAVAEYNKENGTDLDINEYKEQVDKKKGFFRSILDSGKKLGEGIMNMVPDLLKSAAEGMGNIMSKVGESARNAFNALKDGASNLWAKITNGASNMWNTGVEFVQDKWQDIKDGAVNIATNVKETATNIATGVKDGVTNITTGIKDGAINAWNAVTNGGPKEQVAKPEESKPEEKKLPTIPKGTYGFASPMMTPTAPEAGKGPGLMKSMDQTDPEYQTDSSQHMAEVGCGPTTAAMVASAYGKNVNPVDASRASMRMGMRSKDGGTNPAFFQQYGNEIGVNMSQGNPDEGAISSSLHSNKPVVMMGKGGAYGDNMHYMVAKSMDSKGNARVVDPVGGNTKTVPVSDMVRNASTAIYSDYGTGKARNKFMSSNIQIPEYGKGPMPGESPADALIRVAEAEIGYVEKKTNSQLNDKTANTGKGNFTKYGEWYGLNGQPWCAMFVSWCADQAGILKSYIPRYSACADGVNQFKKRNQWKDGSKGYRPRKGDIIFFKGSHTGIVKGSDETTIYTIEGNTSGKRRVERNGEEVCEKQYAINFDKILGFGTPNYGGEPNYGTPGMSSNTSGGVNSSTGDVTSGTSASSGLLGKLSSGLDQMLGPVSQLVSTVGNKLAEIFMPLEGDTAAADGSAIGSDGISGETVNTSSGTMYIPDGAAMIGDYVRKFESGTKGPEMISSGKGDNGGVSFGTYQFPSFNKTPSGGLLQKFWNTYYASKYPGVQPGNNSAFKEAWLKEAKADPATFHKNEWMISKDGDYESARRLLIKKFKYDPNKDSRAAQEAIWSTALQGPKIVPGIYKNAFGDQDVSSMDDREWVKKFYQSKRDKIPQNFAGSSESVRKSIHNRYLEEEPIVAGLANQAPLQYGAGPGLDNKSDVKLDIKGFSAPIEYGTGDVQSYTDTLTREYKNKIDEANSIMNVQSDISESINNLNESIRNTSPSGANDNTAMLTSTMMQMLKVLEVIASNTAKTKVVVENSNSTSHKTRNVVRDSAMSEDTTSRDVGAYSINRITIKD